jgi:hypothetical protein
MRENFAPRRRDVKGGARPNRALYDFSSEECLPVHPETVTGYDDLLKRNAQRLLRRLYEQLAASMAHPLSPVM